MAHPGYVDLQQLFNVKPKKHSGHGHQNARNSHDNVSVILQKGLLGHCIFCLRKLSEDKPVISGSLKTKRGLNESSKDVPKAVINHDLLNTFTEVWKYLQSKQRQKGNHETDEDISLEDIMKDDNSTLGTFSSIPFICQFCADSVQVIGKLLKDLRSQLKEFAKVITESRRGGKFAWRAEQFEAQLLECSLERDTLRSTVNLLNSICSSGIQAAVKTESTDDPAVESYREELFGDQDHHDYDNSSSDHPIDNDHENSREKDSFPDCIKSEVDEDEYKLSEDEQKALSFKSNLEQPYHTSTSYHVDTFAPPPNLSGMTFTKKLEKLGSKFICPLESCDEMFGFRSNVIIHIQVSHPEAMPDFLERKPSAYEKSLEKALEKSLLKEAKKAEKNANALKNLKSKQALEKRKCDMCGVRVAKCDMFEHLSSHVGAEYVKKCPNEECIWMFTNSTALKNHFTRFDTCQKVAESKNIGLSCDTCGFKAGQRVELRAHVEHAHEMGSKKTIKCPISGCAKMFCFKQAVDLHLYSHNLREKTTQKCDQCCKEINSGEEMVNHLKTSHDVNQAIKCQYCPFLFSSRDNLLEHLHEHRHVSLSCDICNDGVKSILFSDFREHYHSVHKVGQKKWKCEQCDAAFWNSSSVYSHVKKKHRSSTSSMISSSEKKKKRYSCDLCFGSVNFAGKVSLEVHKMKVHGDKPYTCDGCGETFKNRTKFSFHKREHGGAKLQTFKCEVEGCERVFKDKKMLKHHNLRGHGERQKNYVCDICGKAYYQANDLRYHHDIVHLELRPYICEECGEGFVSKQVLVIHKRIHTGERPFACTICDQRFRHKEVLKKHVEGHGKKGTAFKPNGPMKNIRKRKAKIKNK